MNTLWKIINYLIVIVVIVLTAYFLFTGPPTQMAGEQEDVLIDNVRQNSGYARLVAWVKEKLGKADQPPLFQAAAIQNLRNNPVQRGDVTDKPMSYNQPFGQNPKSGELTVPELALPDLSNVAPEGPSANPNALPNVAAPLTGMFAATGNPQALPQGGFRQMERVLQAGHWIGLEVNNLTPALANKNGIPQNIKGVLVDKVTLLAAASGFLSGDVIVAINEAPTPDLHAFRAATRPIAMAKQAAVAVYRGGSYRRINVAWNEELGIAQVEAAQMINPTDPSPHGYYGPCDMCHAIAKTIKNAAPMAAIGGNAQGIQQGPPIKWGAKATHPNRGLCTNCHRLI